MDLDACRDAAERLGLSPRHREIVCGLMHGLTVSGVSYELDIRPETVRTHIKRIYRRLDVHSRMELAVALLAEVTPVRGTRD